MYVNARTAGNIQDSYTKYTHMIAVSFFFLHLLADLFSVMVSYLVKITRGSFLVAIRNFKKDRILDFNWRDAACSHDAGPKKVRDFGVWFSQFLLFINKLRRLS